MARLFRRNGASGRNATVQRNDGARGRIENLDELTKLNRGGFSAFAEDVGDQPSFLLPFGRTMRDQELGGQPLLRQPVQMPQMAQLPEQQTEPIPQYEPPQEEQLSPAEEFLTLLEQAYGYANPNQPGMTPEGQMAQGIMSTNDGGTLFSDGIIYYPDGTFRQGDPNAQAIASDQSGGIQYSDGSIRMSYDQQANAPMMSMQGGLQGLTQGIFGQNQTITQPYGAYNPIEPTPGNLNLGVDIRTRDLQGSQRGYKLPIGAEVVEVYNQAQPGTGYVGNMENSGYGNSVLLRLPTGEMLRFSHMDQVADLRPGMRIQPGQVFGIPGSTGNVTGEHLDLEFYNAQGQIADPQTFSGFQNVQSLAQVQPKQFSSPDDPQPQQAQEQQQVQPQNIPTPMTDAITNVVQAPQRVAQQVGQAVQPGSPQRQQLGQITEKAAQTGGIEAEGGLSETITQGYDAGKQARISALSQQPQQQSPYRQLLGNITERIGDTLGVPEGAFSEYLAGGATKRTGQALASEIGKQPEQVPGIRQNIKDISADLLGKAGQGLETLKGFFSNRQAKPELSDIGQKRVVGEVSGATDGTTADGSPVTPTLDSAKALQGQALNDIRDPFFKTGQVNQFMNYLTPGAEKGQALSLDIFQPDFFESSKTGFGDVFKGTSLEGQAQDKYTENRRRMAQELKQKLVSQHGDPLQYDLSEVQRLASSIPDVLPEGYKAPTPTHRTPSLQDYLNAGKTPAQWYAEIRGQSELDRIAGDPSLQYDPKTGTIKDPYSGGRATPDQVGVSESISRVEGRQLMPQFDAPGQEKKVGKSNWFASVSQPSQPTIKGKEIDIAAPKQSSSAKPSFSFTKKEEPGILSKFMGLFKRK